MLRVAALVALLVLLAPLPTVALPVDPEDTGALSVPGGALAPLQGRLGLIVAPTNGAPAFVLAGGTLRVEFDSGPISTRLSLVPSFGGGAHVEMDLDKPLRGEDSTLWTGAYAKRVIAGEGTVPANTPPGLYDIVTEHAVARRAVRVYDAWPETLRIVAVADPQTGDPRALADGAEDAADEGSPAPFFDALDEQVGVHPGHAKAEPAERWAAYREAVRQINELQPDVVLFSGDLTFGQLVPGSYHAEYEEAWLLINGGVGAGGAVYEGFHAPTILSPGNHDGYIASGEDGFAYWMAYFGPLAFKTTLGDVTFVSVNTYDWSELDRTGVSYGVSAWGGQVRAAQLAWLGENILPLADEKVVTFAHHSPSWEQDAYARVADGVPGAEQVARGAISYGTTDQGWSGEGRLALRDLLRAANVDVHLAGHTHRDRIARDVGDGTIVEVPQKARAGLDIRQLQLVTRDGVATAIEQDEARGMMRHGAGPLYVETTTTASDTEQYFGYRPIAWHEGPFPAGARGIAPFEMGYPMTEALLAQLAREPARWNASHADLGLFSVPTFGS